MQLYGKELWQVKFQASQVCKPSFSTGGSEQLKGSINQQVAQFYKTISEKQWMMMNVTFLE